MVFMYICTEIPGYILEPQFPYISECCYNQNAILILIRINAYDIVAQKHEKITMRLGMDFAASDSQNSLSLKIKNCTSK